jgi:exodeoxyribonuclease VII large subunit
MAQFEHESPNLLQLTVSELAHALKRTLEERFGYVRIRGEVSGYRGPHASGHVYFALKDDAARIDAVIWRSTFIRMQVKPEEGLEVIAVGKITTFAGKSSYQIVVETLEPAGVGALMALLETRRRQLAAEGLFDLVRKRPLPFLPRVIGLITSPSGAVVRDIINRLTDRFPTHLIVWPARVQGEGSATEIAAGIRGLNAEFENFDAPRPDVLIVARGGGALEDLWSFNDADVVRAAAESIIPLISAVGHETDWTLLDHAADVRAPTPSAAAEICVPVRADLIARTERLQIRSVGTIGRILNQLYAKLRAASRGTRSVTLIYSHSQQRVDSRHKTLRAIIRSRSISETVELARYSAELANIHPFLDCLKRSRACKQRQID